MWNPATPSRLSSPITREATPFSSAISASNISTCFPMNEKFTIGEAGYWNENSLQINGKYKVRWGKSAAPPPTANMNDGK